MTEILFTQGPGEKCRTIFHVIVRVAFYPPVECYLLPKFSPMYL